MRLVSPAARAALDAAATLSGSNRVASIADTLPPSGFEAAALKANTALQPADIVDLTARVSALEEALAAL